MSKVELMACHPPEEHRDDVSVSEGSRFRPIGVYLQAKVGILRRPTSQNNMSLLGASHRI